MHAPKLYLLDIEGTIAPLTLTTDVLFPYARKHFEAFLKQNLTGIDRLSKEGTRPADDSVLSDLWLLWEENWSEKDAEAPRIALETPVWMLQSDFDAMQITMASAIFVPRALKYISWLMDRDRKSTALKSLQGKIWKAGFESGELKGTLFSDVPAALQRWAAQARVAIYSSGSAEAQQLLFRHSVFGDLTAHLSGYFDTRIGAKREPASYRAIATAMQIPPAEVLFFSDVVAELNAAREAGCQTRLVVRPGNPAVNDPQGHQLIDSLDAD